MSDVNQGSLPSETPNPLSLPQTASEVTEGSIPISAEEAAEAAKTATEEAKKFTIEDVDRRFFSPEDLTDAQTAVDQIQSNIAAKMVQWNFNP